MHPGRGDGQPSINIKYKEITKILGGDKCYAKKKKIEAEWRGSGVPGLGEGGDIK